MEAFSTIKLLALVLHVASADKCGAMSGVYGYSLTRRVIRQTSALNYEQCLSFCEKQRNCHSINFIAAGNNTCELNWSTRYRDPGNFVEKEDAQYSQTLPSRNPPVCESGWIKFQASCYLFIRRAQSWPEAHEDCERLGTRLAVVTSEGENEFLARHVNQSTFIGLSDKAEEGRWVWEDGPDLVYENFAEGEPNNADGREDFVAINVDGRWNDLALFHTMPYICQRS